VNLPLSLVAQAKEYTESITYINKVNGTEATTQMLELVR